MNQNEPLAYRIRPKTLEEFFGQEHILGKDKLISKLIIVFFRMTIIKTDKMPDMYLR